MSRIIFCICKDTNFIKKRILYFVRLHFRLKNEQKFSCDFDEIVKVDQLIHRNRNVAFTECKGVHILAHIWKIYVFSQQESVFLLEKRIIRWKNKILHPRTFENFINAPPHVQNFCKCTLNF